MIKTELIIVELKNLNFEFKEIKKQTEYYYIIIVLKDSKQFLAKLFIKNIVFKNKIFNYRMNREILIAKKFLQNLIY